jgi:hypothetical protein
MTRLPPLAEGVPGVEEEVVVVPLLQAEAPVIVMVRAARAAKDLRKGTSGEEWVTLSRAESIAVMSDVNHLDVNVA